MWSSGNSNETLGVHWGSFPHHLRSPNMFLESSFCVDCLCGFKHALFCPFVSSSQPPSLGPGGKGQLYTQKPLSQSLFCGHKPLLCFLFSFFPLLWLSDIPSAFPPSPPSPRPLCPVTHAHAHMQAHFFLPYANFSWLHRPRFPKS